MESDDTFNDFRDYQNVIIEMRQKPSYGISDT